MAQVHKGGPAGSPCEGACPQGDPERCFRFCVCPVPGIVGQGLAQCSVCCPYNPVLLSYRRRNRGEGLGGFPWLPLEGSGVGSAPGPGAVLS